MNTATPLGPVTAGHTAHDHTAHDHTGHRDTARDTNTAHGHRGHSSHTVSPPVVAIAWPTGRPIYAYTAQEIAEGVDLYTRYLKARRPRRRIRR